ncbi:NADH:ubiquinone reductase (non-electrogenic) OS=Tsukamurella paurometabola (strain ATCC 8368 / DSM / CCUG 35730 / CIP 100753 / JCM 10117 / KCTC 9821 / NBRC 16120 / NCIMB 702349 / NCTC 13040) OX=521096 GN=Tpau_2310 PE=3 SV=1 [Tsukamurella paurometabola]|uniref:NADH:ubiquinone reductase (non-electrogenic) n=1 Tax=Tsukamurella paurometabola (strain ATCC 8368 / DSM 20162 / CCUG 35730 / CIP 100753 / JCM 10117 / KCTC 9821 / NBRC 16120 / NCIMB 702349 / NCTC 13040) TaxID=521096 RepID=D5UQE7_TSUPD|nr:NAD(P)/FAD-dependent oxidoreductase [Tsukamurella paurometabola]ADG78917.1 FAD-dependent pyridine nucleotide-disulfide oxidoreductase [Tsukamurella paurometabola DSM 20162]SUP33504.1 NADH dehydrogenase-like protein SAV0941 [Tsukamurella paurometabola]
MSEGTHRHKVVVIGSGFGGLFGTKALKRADVDVTVIAKTQHHLFQPLLYQVATGILSEGEIAPASRVVLRKQKNAQVLLGEVTDIDLENRTVTSHLLDRVTVTPFDSLIVAAGANQSYFGNDRFAEFAPGMKTIDDALELRGRILGAFEQAELSHDHDERERLLTFVVIGAGPTGVELAGQIAEMSDNTLKGAFRNIDPTEARVILLDAAPAVLPPMGEKLGNAAADRLRKMGVEIQLNAMVVDVDADGLVVKEKDGTERRIEAQCKVWSAGVSASPLGKIIAEQSGAEVDRAGRVKVLPDLTVPGNPNVFVVGDMMAVDGVPGMAQGAIQGSTYAAKAIKAGLAGQSPADRKPFKYFDKGSMATVSRASAVAKVGKLEFSGFFAWLGWLALHLWYIVGYQNRVITLTSWGVTFLTNKRGQMTITEQQVYARTALDALQNSGTKVIPPVHTSSPAALSAPQAAAAAAQPTAPKPEAEKAEKAG